MTPKKLGKKSNDQLPYGLKEIAIGLIPDYCVEPPLAHEPIPSSSQISRQ